MQFPASLLATITLALLSVDARPVKRSNGMITLPIRKLQRDSNLHVELRHQQHMNRAERLVARAAGLPGPSDAQLSANLERRASFLSPSEKRFNRPSSDYLLPSEDSDSDISNLAVENDDTSSNSRPVLAQKSSDVQPEGNDASYVATVQLGTPSRDFVIILDSGSGDFWVESDVCVLDTDNSQGCGNHSFLSEASSSSFVNTHKDWSITYGSGAAAGELVTDTLVLGGMVLGNHTFGVAHNVSQSFASDRIADGLMGLGRGALSNQNTPTPVQSLVNAGFIKQAITSYRLPRIHDNVDVGEVTFGGLDNTKFDPSTLVTVNCTDNGFYIPVLDGITVNGASLTLLGTHAIMDTGTSLLVAPKQDAAAIHAKIPGAKLQNSGQYSVPCNTAASVALKFGGKEFAINPKDLVFASGGRTTGDCSSGIGAFTDDTARFLVGDTFLKAVYFSTNDGENTITLAKAI
ncbi:acid protease [Mycena alexandri]|uniref:Acid protease n=1 Tax=Mycena alexandri TaxID=1745969 RepID=A0AAD6T628_9AGAR|nr:acid protease [Mycena alexandri]